MAMTLHLAVWLLLSVASMAVLSWILARYQQRLVQAESLLLALHRYSQWVRAQRLAPEFQGEGREAEAALETACAIRLAWFPELEGDMAQLLAVHKRLLHFLATQQALWLRDPTHWLESGHDRRFMALWQQHRLALEALLGDLEGLASVHIPSPSAPPRRKTTYA